MALSFRDGLVHDIYTVANPDKLGHALGVDLSNFDVYVSR